MDNLTAGNPRAHRVRVYWEDDEATIYEGMPVCYNYLTTDNWFGGSVSDAGVVTANNTTAEGSQNKGKYIRVNGPAAVAVTGATFTQATKLLTGTTTDFDDLQVGMFVKVASATDSDIDGNYGITAIDRSTESAITNSTITLDMTAVEAAAVTDSISDVTVDINNIASFLAGVVAKGGWCGRTGPRVLDIYVTNGAIVPVRCDVDTVCGETILSVESGSQEFSSNPTYTHWNRPVAVAVETETGLDSTADITFAKLDPNMFIWQDAQKASGYLQTGVGAGGMALNRIAVQSNHTSGSFCGLEIKTTSGVAESSYGLAFMARAIITDTPTAATSGTGIRLNLTGGTPTYGLSALRVQLTAGSSVVLTSLALPTNISVLNLVNQLSVAPTAGTHNWIYLENDGSNPPDGLFYAKLATDIPMTAQAGGTQTHEIPFIAAGTTYYLMVTTGT